MGIRRIEIFMKYVDFTGKQTKREIRSREYILNISDILNYNSHLLVSRMHSCYFFLPKYQNTKNFNTYLKMPMYTESTRIKKKKAEC